METMLVEFADAVASMLEAIAVALVAVGGLEALFRTLAPIVTRRDSHGSRRAAWLGYARWLVLSLEFMLAADIVRTVIEPGLEDLAQLAAIAVIRTFLNFFLERDLEAAARQPEAT